MAFLNDIQAWFDANALMVNGAIRANWSTDVTLGSYKARWANWEPFIATLLTVSALFLLSISSPQRKWLLTSSVSLFEKFRAIIGIIELINFITVDTRYGFILIVSSMPPSMSSTMWYYSMPRVSSWMSMRRSSMSTTMWGMSWDVHWTMVFWMMDRTNLRLRRIIVSMRIMVGELLMEMWLCMSIMERRRSFSMLSWMSWKFRMSRVIS